MKYIEENGLRILYPEYGHLLRNTVTGRTHASMICLSITSSVEDFEEIPNPLADPVMINTMNVIHDKEKSLTKIGKIVANQVTDDVVALEIQEFYDEWKSGISYEVGRYVTFNNILYKVLTEHTSQDDWTPDASPSLFANVLTSLDGTPQEWERPDSTNAYMIGDKVIFESIVYESIIDNNVWSPTEYPQGWKVVE